MTGKMKTIILLFVAVICALASTTAQAQLTLLGAPGAALPPSYVGPLDVLSSGVNGCYSLRACSAAYATGSNPALVETCNSVNYTINILSTGKLDIATAKADCSGYWATFTATTVGTTLTVGTGTIGTMAAGQQLNMPGLGQAITLSSGTTCTGSACNGSTWTLSAAPYTNETSVAAGSSAILVSTWYDQTANGFNLTDVNGPTYLIPLEFWCTTGAAACIVTSVAGAGQLRNNGITISAAPVTTALVGTAQFVGGSYNFPMVYYNSCYVGLQGTFAAIAPGATLMYYGTTINVGAPVAGLNALAFQFTGTGNDEICVNGACTTGLNSGSSCTSVSNIVVAPGSAQDYGESLELISYLSAPTTVQMQALQTNQGAYSW